MNESLEKFGAFFVRNFRDRMLHDLEMILQGAWKAPDLQKLQQMVARLGDGDKQMLRELVERLSTTGMHDLLFALQEQADDDAGTIRLLVDGKEVAKLSDGLHGEIFGEEGWIARFSSYPAPEQAQLTRWAEDEVRKMLGTDKEQSD
jgi:hypothetical protein